MTTITVKDEFVPLTIDVRVEFVVLIHVLEPSKLRVGLLEFHPVAW